MTSKNIYLDLQMCNLSSIDKEINFNETRFAGVISKPHEYELSITRFQVSTSSILLPVFMPVIQIDSDEADETVYSITLKYSGYETEVFVKWSPEIESITKPSKIQGNIQSKSEYYYAYNYSWFPSLIQNTLRDALLQLQEIILEQTGENELKECLEPYFYFDNSTGSSIMALDSKYFASNGDDGIEIYFNIPLYNMFSSFFSTFDGTKYKIIKQRFMFSFFKFIFIYILIRFSSFHNKAPQAIF